MIALTLGRTVRLALFSAGLLAPLSIGLLIRVGGGEADAAAVVTTVAVTPCDATRFDATCPDGQRCVADVCTAVRVAERAPELGSCAGLECAPGLECHRGTCMRVEKLLLAPRVCREADVHAALTELIRSCAHALERSDALLTDCEAGVWRSLSQRNTGLERHVMAMPGAFSVFFPDGMPDERWSWPSAEVSARYAAMLTPHIAALRGARQILVIGRASVTGDEAANERLAERRAVLVEKLVVEQLGPSPPPISRWGLADNFTLAIESVRRRMRADPIAADDAAVAELEQLRRPDFKFDGLKRDSWDRLSHTLNRVVFVVPLPCDGREFNPQPAFRGPPGSERRR